jgi:S-adenosylmethionine decarboxylase
MDARDDYFVERDGEVFAGLHLIVDLIEAKHLDECDYIESALIRAAEAAGATVLSSDFHVFTPNNGVSGVLVLAESHISIHTWPERDFAAVDVFMCGACDPKNTIPVLRSAFSPSNMVINEIRRGLTT